jgi:uncharacterized membrane protein YebE (DUF533 family)
MIDPGSLVEGVLRGVLGGRRKRTRGALRFLTGNRDGPSLVNASTLMTAAGVAWGIFETMQASGSGRDTAGSADSSVSSTSGGSVNATPPPIPQVSSPDTGTVPTDALRMIRLAISAANADGTLGDAERELILQHARAAAAEHLIAGEVQQRHPLGEIVRGVTDAAQKATLYVLAFAIVRADETVSGAERIYLAQLANLLGLNPAMVQQLEQDASTRIDRED